jgi:hypothetical protein
VGELRVVGVVLLRGDAVVSWFLFDSFDEAQAVCDKLWAQFVALHADDDVAVSVFGDAVKVTWSDVAVSSVDATPRVAALRVAAVRSTSTCPLRCALLNR